MKAIDLFVNPVALGIFFELCKFKDEVRYLNKLGFSKPYARYVIKELVDYGFFKVEGLDKRKHLITITEKGQCLYKLLSDFNKVVCKT